MTGIEKDTIEPMEPTVFLFDIDGVLIKPGGYRAAVRATVNYFTRYMGLGDLAPDDETIGIFEAQGITCEWDMVPLLIATALEVAVECAPVLPQLDSLESARDWVSEQSALHTTLHVDYEGMLRKMGRYVQVGVAPSDSILAVCQDGCCPGLFQRLGGQGVLAELLANTRWLERSPTTPIFEVFALGDDFYTRSTGLPALLKAESLLARYDRPLLAPGTRERLLALRSLGQLCMAAYTARPSQPSGKPEDRLSLYAPEAEMALDQVGLGAIPLLGSGQMGEAARCLGEHEDRLMKPAPYHAIAAVAAAWTNDRLAALEWVKTIFLFLERQQGTVPTLRTSAGSLPGRLSLHIFEDSPAGMHGGRQAVDILAGLGMDVALSLWGVSSNPEKAAALHATGARVFPDVNQALSAALQTF